MSDVICTCLGITDDTIIEAIKNGAHTVGEVGEATGAGTICGSCQDEIQRLIDENK